MELLSQDVLEMLNVTETVTDTSLEHAVFGFVDPSSSNSSTRGDPMMGWPLRNLIAYLAVHLNLGGRTVKIGVS
jgi:hypothetical protein